MKKKRVFKKHPTISEPRVPGARRSNGWMVCGFDTSPSAITGAALAYDKTLKKLKGPKFMCHRWDTSTDYFKRLEDCSRSHEFVIDLQRELKVIMESDEIFIAQEEPWPVGMVGKGASGWLKQQAEISGAFLAGLARWGYPNIVQMGSIRWRTMVAEDLGITTHFSKWRSPELAARYNCKPEDSGKFRAKQWALSNQGYAFQSAFSEEVPDLPDIIERKQGKIPRPEGSTAKAVQPADEYDALAIAWTMYLELENTKEIRIPT